MTRSAGVPARCSRRSPGSSRVALIIPWVDAYSVWRGPTKAITTHHVGVFTTLSIAFVVPGGGAARLGLPDVMFFAVFLAASVRFGLRPLRDLAGDDRRRSG